MRKISALLLLCVFISTLGGCASVQKKFTRKKKETKAHSALYFQEGAYQKKYSNDYYYKTHFTMWRSWQDELILQLGGNNKKVSRCAQEAMGHLTEMNGYLLPEKQSELKPEIDSLSKIVKRFETSGYGDSELGPVKVDLERIKRVVSNGFYYDKVKGQLAPDDVDLGDQEEAAEQAPEAAK